ncbi:MAG: allantoate amidohydrolase [Verrucomicrobia bacterium]|nr:allantoate amidohydrolase [Verrucomicrobiota bacterium]
MQAAKSQLVRMLDELGRITDEPGRLTRTFLSPAMRRANARVATWMRAAGLSVREDSTGNLVGRLEANCRAGSPDPAGGSETSGVRRPRPTKTLLLGSHLDTVRDAGKFDGALGVLLPIVALGELRRRGVALPFAVEVLGFSEEEGVRFASAYLGSKGFSGRLSAADLKLRDEQGVSVREAIQRWSALTPARFGRLEKRVEGNALHLQANHRRSNLMGYLEVHIEQGPVLENKQLAVGVVSAIAGQTRGRLTFRGRAGHAGTTPMELRRDALAGAAEFVLFVETSARAVPPLVATVGTVAVEPGAPNVIPGEVTLSLDVRHPRDDARDAALKLLLYAAGRIARRRKLGTTWSVTQDNPAVTCSAPLSAALTRSVVAVQGRSVELVSGAGHDAVVMSALTPVAMLFVRCRDGLSHHPDEFASRADLAVALRVVGDFLQRLAREQSS